MDSPEQLSRDIDYRRERISETVDEIGNRIMPGRIAERNKYRASERMKGWRDSIMGAGEPVMDIRHRAGEQGGHLMERAEHGLDEARDMAREVPDRVRERAEGAPIVAGVFAYSLGFMFGALLPGTQREERAVQRIQPELQEAMSEAKETGRQVAEELREPAREVAQDVSETAKGAAQHTKEDAMSSARRTSEQGGM